MALTLSALAPPITDDIFVYVDGIPTKGMWIEVGITESWAEIKLELVAEGIIPRDYDGDLLVSDSTELATPFVGPHGTFDLDAYIEWRDAEGDSDAKVAYLDWVGYQYRSLEEFHDTFRGWYESKVEFAQEWFDDIHGESIRQAEQAGLRIDWDGTADDLFTDGFYMASDSESGHVFARQ